MVGERGELECVQLALEGDREALARLFERYRGPLTGFLSRITHDAHLACDLAQETFVRAYLGIRRLQHPEGFRAWLFRIAFHVAIDWRRRESRGWVSLDGSEDRALAVPGERERQETEWDRDGLRERVRAGVRSIPEPYALLLLLHYYGGLSCREIAEVTYLTVANVKIRLFRARHALKRKLAKMGGGGVMLAEADARRVPA